MSSNLENVQYSWQVYVAIIYREIWRFLFINIFPIAIFILKWRIYPQGVYLPKEKKRKKNDQLQ